MDKNSTEKNIVEILSTHGYNEISGNFVYDYL